MRTISGVSVSVLLLAAAAAAPAQWLNYPSPGLARTGNGKPNLAAPTPKAVDGKPDLSGIWKATDGTHYRDLVKDVGPEGAPLQPWAKALSAQREGGVHKDDRLAQCLPPGVPRVATHGQQPFKILQMPRELVILYETSTNDAFREIFTDGRPRPEITQPSWTCCGDVPYRNWARFPAQAITWTSKLSKSK